MSEFAQKISAFAVFVVLMVVYPVIKGMGEFFPFFVLGMVTYASFATIIGIRVKTFYTYLIIYLAVMALPTMSLWILGVAVAYMVLDAWFSRERAEHHT